MVVAVVLGFGIAQLRSLRRAEAARHPIAREGQGSERRRQTDPRPIQKRPEPNRCAQVTQTEIASRSLAR
jgi:hypothetical protein